MMPEDYFHSLGYSQIVVIIQNGFPRTGGNRYSEDKTHYVFVALDKDGKTVKANFFHTYSPAKGDSYVGSTEKEIDPAEHERLMALRGTMEKPKPYDPNGPRWCLRCGGKKRTYHNRGGDVHVCRSCGDRSR